MFTRGRFLGTLLVVATLAACGGPSIPGLPSPSSGIGALTDVFSSQFGLPSGVADQAVGGLLGVANSNLPSNTWDAIAGNIPGAGDLLSQTLSGLPSGSSLESLDDVGDMLGAGAGVSPSQLTNMGSMMGDFLGSAVSDGGMKSQIQNLFR
jgi:hypothetical protein